MNSEAEQRPWIVLVGGFLGAGKTSLILAAARVLEQRGVRCAAVMNDQGYELVDTRLAGARGVPTREVMGGCFCCRYSALMTAVEELRAWRPEVIFAEPVGSCTDISATVFGPLREEFGRYRVAPFTVLVDPERAGELLGDDADLDMKFLFETQRKEADLVCMSKADLYPEASGIDAVKTRRLSAKTGQGVAEWLDEILAGGSEAGVRTLEIDYARYAEAEAALAWMNLSFVFEPAGAATPAAVVGPMMEEMDAALSEAGISIVHLKVFDSSAAGWVKAAMCANGVEPRVEGMLDASAAERHEVLVNLRAKGDAAAVRRVVEEQMQRMVGQKLYMRLECFHPAAPKPERRVPRVMA
jgi:hypothetical protein